jgi:hypothetical protein
MNKYIKDITGQKFGNLLVLEFSHVEKEKARWKCLCEKCGKEVIIRSNTLLSGRAISCGCHGKIVTRKPPGVRAWNTYFYSYKSSAKIRNISFDLTFEEFKEICTKNCYYSDHSPRKINKIKNDKRCKKFYTQEGINRQIIYANGIDRLDNNKGYTVNNCVACCRICNTMKMELSVEEFKNHIKILSERINEF